MIFKIIRQNDNNLGYIYDPHFYEGEELQLCLGTLNNRYISNTFKIVVVLSSSNPCNRHSRVCRTSKK